MRLHPFALLALLVTGACGDASDDSTFSDSFVDEDPPMGGCESGGTGPCAAGSADGASAEDEPCDGTNQCADGLSCAAPFSAGDPGRLVCRATCIEIGDPTSWCSDDAACCTGTCGPRGLCLADDEGADTSETSGTGSSGGNSSTSN